MVNAVETRGRKPRFDHAEAIELYKDIRHTFASLALKYGVTRSAVSEVIQRKAPHLKREAGDAIGRNIDLDLAITMAESGDYSMPDIAAHFKVSLKTVYALFHATGVKLPMATSYDHQQMLDLYATGRYSQTEMARMFKTSQSNISGVIQRKAPHLKPGRRRGKQGHYVAARDAT